MQLQDKFDEQTLHNTVVNRSINQREMQIYQPSGQISDAPETHHSKYLDQGDVPTVLLMYGESVFRFNLLQQSMTEYSLNSLLGVSLPSSSQINSNGILYFNT